MSTTVVPAPAVQAKRPVRSDKPATRKDEQTAVNEDEERAAQDDSEEQVSVASDAQERAPAAASETSLAGGFTFGTALAEAAAVAGSLSTEAEEADEAGFSQFGDDGGSTILLVGAIALVGLGIYVLADGGSSNKNEAPSITDGDQPRAVTTTEDTPVVINVAATDPDSDALTFTATGATKGTVTVGANGALTYTPNANANGMDSFTVTVRDPDGLTDTQTVNVTITPVDDAVSFSQDTAAITVDEDAVFSGSLAALAVDPDGDGVLSIATQAGNGTVVLNQDGTYTYTPDADFFGTDSYVIRIADGASSDTITVNVTVANVNDDPDFGVDDQSFDIGAGTTLEGVLQATDIDGDDLTYDVETDPENGTLTVDENGDLTYTPDDGFIGTDTFTVNVSDGNGGSDTLDITVNVLEDVVTEVSIDVPASGPAVVIEAGDGEFRFTDDATERTDVIIKDFSADDVIVVTGADVDDYNFGTGVGAGGGDDLRITFNDGTNFTQIIIEDVIQSGFVFDYDSAAAAIGIDNFITFA